ncbi:MAG TPA: bifunctional riboflavin kinase/FAD synthetase [Candidatus Binatia bacterium]|jgi:riboflavin kinase/FMN adenylyltransferase|nr:bifunctional riboflavin kinase/FAD synthetase [Candidatus Binatia bacterium]
MTLTYERVTDLSQVSERKPTFLAIGVFDGVHGGHQELLQTMAAAAREAGAEPAVLTFFPHPREVIQGAAGRMYLTTLERRVRLLAAQGMDLVIVHPFDEEVRQTRAADFVDRLCRHLDLQELWGGSFSLGYQREGDADFLRRIGKERGFAVHEISELVLWNGEAVSSSRIRHALALGDMATVNGCLRRRFTVSGEVFRGDQRGRTIGFPTANLDVWDRQLLPANGVYAAYAQLGEERFLAATNVGVRPTVADPRLLVEAHLLDFDGDIYGQELALEFVTRIRDERKFPGLDALKAQIAADVGVVRQLL